VGARVNPQGFALDLFSDSAGLLNRLGWVRALGSGFRFEPGRYRTTSARTNKPITMTSQSSRADQDGISNSGLALGPLMRSKRRSLAGLRPSEMGSRVLSVGGH
jgi:hypothetical protein